MSTLVINLFVLALLNHLKTMESNVMNQIMVKHSHLWNKFLCDLLVKISIVGKKIVYVLILFDIIY